MDLPLVEVEKGVASRAPGLWFLFFSAWHIRMGRFRHLLRRLELARIEPGEQALLGVVALMAMEEDQSRGLASDSRQT